jgi:hypothetical protein
MHVANDGDEEQWIFKRFTSQYLCRIRKLGNEKYQNRRLKSTLEFSHIHYSLSFLLSSPTSLFPLVEDIKSCKAKWIKVYERFLFLWMYNPTIPISQNPEFLPTFFNYEVTCLAFSWSIGSKSCFSFVRLKSRKILGLVGISPLGYGLWGQSSPRRSAWISKDGRHASH